MKVTYEVNERGRGLELKYWGQITFHNDIFSHGWDSIDMVDRDTAEEAMQDVELALELLNIEDAEKEVSGE